MSSRHETETQCHRSQHLGVPSTETVDTETHCVLAERAQAVTGSLEQEGKPSASFLWFHLSCMLKAVKLHRRTWYCSEYLPCTLQTLGVGSAQWKVQETCDFLLSPSQ